MRKIPDVSVYEHAIACMRIFENDRENRKLNQENVDKIIKLIQEETEEVFKRVPHSEDLVPEWLMSYARSCFATIHLEILLKGMNDTGVPLIKRTMKEIVDEDIQNTDVSEDGVGDIPEGNMPQSPSGMHN